MLLQRADAMPLSKRMHGSCDVDCGNVISEIAKKCEGHGVFCAISVRKLCERSMYEFCV